MEHWESLKPGGYRFVYDYELFPPGTDTFALSSLPKLRPGLRTVDLGCGTGLLGLLLMQRQPGLRVTGVVNNSHLRDQTDASTVIDALDFGRACAVAAGVDLVCTTVPKMSFEQINQAFSQEERGVTFYPVSMLVRTPWE